MPIPIVCPNPLCRRSGKLPDTFPGGPIKCPACEMVWTVEAPRRQAPGPATLKTFVEPPTAPSASSRGPQPPTYVPPARPTYTAPPPRAVAAPPPDLDLLEEPEAADEAPMTPWAARTRGGAPTSGMSPTKIGLLAAGGALGLILVVGTIGLIVSGDKKPAGEEMTEVAAVAAPVPAPPVAPAPAPVSEPGPLVAVANVEPAPTTTATPPAPPAPTPGPPVAPPPATPTSYQAPASSGPAESPEAIIKRIKDATVYIKVNFGKKGATGTGFVIQTAGNTALIATNRHVAAPQYDEEGAKEMELEATDRPTIQVVFRSGEGPGREQTVPGSLVAVDIEQHHGRDLAMIRVQGLTNPPRPIDLAQKVEAIEGMPVKIFGFPFGTLLNVAGHGNPAITVSSGNVASLRRDDYGKLSLIQIDGSMNPGNSGGPIVDEKGRLVAVVVAKFAVVDGIGYAIPADEVRRMLDGRVGGILMNLTALETNNTAALEVKALLADPMSKVRAVGLQYAPAGEKRPDLKPLPDGSFPALPNSQKAALALDRGQQVATGQIRASLDGAVNRRLLIQASYQDASGRTLYASPIVYDVPSKPGRLALLGRSEQIRANVRRTVGKLGTLVDPDRDCELDLKGEDLKITIPGTLHVLSPQLKDKKGQSLKNAPMTLAPVDGDFLIHAEVEGDFRPGTEPPKSPTGRKIPLTFQGAGLILWQDKENYLRLERACQVEAGAPILSHRLLMEVCQSNKLAAHAYIEIPEGSLHLMMVRKGGHLRMLFGPDGKKWVVFKELAFDFPDKVQIGLTAANISKKPMTAKFQNVVLLDDRDKIDEEFKSEDEIKPEEMQKGGRPGAPPGAPGGSQGGQMRPPGGRPIGPGVRPRGPRRS